MGHVFQKKKGEKTQKKTMHRKSPPAQSYLLAYIQPYRPNSYTTAGIRTRATPVPTRLYFNRLILPSYLSELGQNESI